MPRKISYRMSKLSTSFAKARKKAAERARKKCQKVNTEYAKTVDDSDTT